MLMAMLLVSDLIASASYFSLVSGFKEHWLVVYYSTYAAGSTSSVIYESSIRPAYLNSY